MPLRGGCVRSQPPDREVCGVMRGTHGWAGLGSSRPCTLRSCPPHTARLARALPAPEQIHRCLGLHLSERSVSGVWLLLNLWGVPPRLRQNAPQCCSAGPQAVCAVDLQYPEEKPGRESARTVIRMSTPGARGKGRGSRGGSLCTLCSQNVTQYVAVVVVLKREGHLGACVFPNA